LRAPNHAKCPPLSVASQASNLQIRTGNHLSV
jgi:hypothetical protein